MCRGCAEVRAPLRWAPARVPVPGSAGQCHPAARSGARAVAQLCAGSRSVLELVGAGVGTGPGRTRALWGSRLEPGQLSLRLLHVKDIRSQWVHVITRVARLAAETPLSGNSPALRGARGATGSALQLLAFNAEQPGATGCMGASGPGRRASAVSGGREARGMLQDPTTRPTAATSCLQPCSAALEGPSGQPGSLPVPAEPMTAELASGQAAVGDAMLAVQHSPSRDRPPRHPGNPCAPCPVPISAQPFTPGLQSPPGGGR